MRASPDGGEAAVSLGLLALMLLLAMLLWLPWLVFQAARRTARIAAAAHSLNPAELDLAACLIECISARRPLSRGRGRRAEALAV